MSNGVKCAVTLTVLFYVS